MFNNLPSDEAQLQVAGLLAKQDSVVQIPEEVMLSEEHLVLPSPVHIGAIHPAICGYQDSVVLLNDPTP